MTMRAGGGWLRLWLAIAIVAAAVSSPLSSRELSGQAPQAASDPRELLKAGNALLDAKQFDDAKSTLQAAIAAVNDSGLQPRDRDGIVARAEYVLGRVAERSGRMSDALPHFERALALFEQLDDSIGIAEAAVGVVTFGRHAFAEEERLIEKALPHARRTGLKKVEADLLHLWADGMFVEGQYERAYHMLLEAESVAKAIGDIEKLGTVYNSMGRLYRNHGQFETALSFQLKALALHEKLPNSLVLVQSLNAVGVTYQTLGDHRRARSYLTRALDSSIVTTSPRVQDFIRANLVSSLKEQGAYEESARVLEGVIARGLDAYPHQRLTALSETYRLMGRSADALAASDKAVTICGSRDDPFCFAALDERAQTHLALGNRAAAHDDLASAGNMLERIRARLIPADFTRQNFGAALQSWYGRTIEMQLTDGRVREALDTAERGRSRAFVDLLASRDVVLQEGARAARAATIDDLDRVATRLGSTLLMYWVTPARLYIWTVAPGGDVHSATVAVRESKLAALVQATAPFGAGQSVGARGALTPAAGADAEPWRQLYDLLIKPVRASLPHTPGALITIVPHGPLSMLSFAALQDSRRRYLLEDFMLHYVPAGAVLDFTVGRRRDNARSGDMLVVADPAYHRKSSLDAPLAALPGSRAEARSIVGLSPRGRVTVLEGNAASEDRVRATTAGKSVLHFATHAIVNDAEPFSSFLALGGSANPGDGTLTAQEIYGLNLQADVVVLSACRSGGGRVTGDGMATFARAFMYAGTPSLITSVWDVADESSAQLIPGFYRSWRAGESKARALRNTQLAFLRDLRAGTVTADTVAGRVVLPEHPALWAGFMLIGEPD